MNSVANAIDSVTHSVVSLASVDCFSEHASVYLTDCVDSTMNNEGKKEQPIEE